MRAVGRAAAHERRRRHLLKELEVRQAEGLLEAAADRAAARLSADAAWPGDLRTVSADEIVGSGPAEVTTEIAAAGEGSRSIHIVIEYPAGRADSVRRERVFPFTSFPGTSPPASDPVPPIAALISRNFACGQVF